MATHAERLGRLERILDVVEQIRDGNDGDDFGLAGKLNERLALLLGGSPEHLLKTRELADWKFSANTKAAGDALDGDALDEVQAEVLALGPSPSWH